VVVLEDGWEILKRGKGKKDWGTNRGGEGASGTPKVGKLKRRIGKVGKKGRVEEEKTRRGNLALPRSGYGIVARGWRMQKDHRPR
jgi:hypothetical protein